MPRGSRTTAFMASVAVLLFLSTATVGSVAADGTAAKQNVQPKVPQFRPWRIYDVPKGGALVFDCARDVPTLRVVATPGSAENAGNMPVSSCGGPEAGTPTQYRYGHPGKPDTGTSALYWAAPDSGDDGSELMPAPKIQLIAIPKFVAAVMDLFWKDEKGEPMPESVAFPADTFLLYTGQQFIVMGREDMEFRERPAVVHGKASSLNLGAVM